jgi:flagellar hook-basal body complex protein FliE
MPSPISAITNLPAPEAVRPPTESGKPGEFGEILASAIRQVERSRAEAGQSVGNFLSGETEDLHTAVLAVEKAELAFDLFLQVRGKVVQAYQEIMRMQI